MGLYLLVKHKDNPCKVWLAHQEHQQKSESSMREAQNLLVEIYELRIKNFPTRIDFLTTWTRLLAEHGDISEALNDATKSSILQVAVRLDPAMVTMFSNFLSLRKLQGKDDDVIPYEELLDRVQTNFLISYPTA